MPKVSVIIPVYGVEKYIERCARSLFEQTLDDIEYIFVDDCTPDKSIEILETIIEEYRLRFAEEKKTVRIVRMPTNSGLPAVRRHGIQLATGDYIIHCDSDDWVDVDMYRAMYEKSIADKADMAVCDYYFADEIESKAVANHYCNEPLTFLKDLMLIKNSWSLCNKMIRRDVYLNNSIIYPVDNMGEDMALTFQLAYYSNRVAVIDKPLYYYYQNTGSITHEQNRQRAYSRYHQAINNTNIVLAFFEKNSINKKFKKEIILLKNYERNQCLMLIDDKKIRKEWLSTYPELNIQIIFSPYYKIDYKLKFILIALGLRNGF